MNGFIANFCQYCGSDLHDSRYTSKPYVKYGGFWRRLAAYIIDNLLVYLAAGLSFVLIGLMLTLPDPGWHGFWDFRILLGPVLPWLYWAIMESSPYQATFGKMLMGLKVTDMEGRRISFMRASVRYWSKLLSAMLLLGGFIMIAFTKKKEGLHDVIAGSLVVIR